MTNKQKKVDIELPTSEVGGKYSNMVIVSNSRTEFVLDFVSMMPGTPKARIERRIIMSPEHIKNLLITLSNRVEKYEDEHGKIKSKQVIDIPMNFQSPIPEA